MKALVRSAGYGIVDSPDRAHVAVVNTCSFLTEACEESIDTIFSALDDSTRELDTPLKLIVSGCLTSRYGSDLADELDEAAAFLACEDEEHIVELIARLTETAPLDSYHLSRDLRYDNGPSAYVKISDGCDRFCAFCAIPFIRGRYHSRPLGEIAAEVALLVGEGVREIVLIGQDTGIWGNDLDGPSTLTTLLDDLASRFPETWFRVLYVQPEGITDGLLDVITSHANICDYLDIPLQHASAAVLSDMNRTGSGTEYAHVISHVRERIPDIRLRTTFICGFPGETEEQFEELLAFAEDAAFDYAGVFPYSQEEGTAAGARTDQIPLETRIYRTNRLREVCERTGFERSASHVGETADVLFEGFEETDKGTESIGRLMGQAPEIDGGVHVADGDIAPGTILRVLLTDSFCYEFEGEVRS